MRILIILLVSVFFSGCLPPTLGQPPMGDRYLGTFEANGTDYQEVIRIYDSDGIKFEHLFYKAGVLIVNETGNVKIDGYDVEFIGDFTECIDSESRTPLPSPITFGSYSMILLREGDPETDRLLPFTEHPYHLEKKQNQVLGSD